SIRARCDAIWFTGGTAFLPAKAWSRRALFSLPAKSGKFRVGPTNSSFCSRRLLGCARNGFENCSQTTFGSPAWSSSIRPPGARLVLFDSAPLRVEGRLDLIFGDLILKSSKIETPPPEQAAEILASELVDGRCPLVNWTHEVDQWIARVSCLSNWFPELQLPGVDQGARLYLIQQICHGALSYKEIKDRPVWPVVRGWLSKTQQEYLDRFAPERFELPNGRRNKLHYAEGQLPVLAARIQDLYGVEGPLSICSGRVPIVVHVLAPNHRPIQITQDLATFWKEAYPKIKQELCRKYPKHEWR